MLQIRELLTRPEVCAIPGGNHDYSVAQMVLALIYPLILALDRLETASFLRSNGTFQYLTGLPSFPDPQTLRRFLLNAPERLWQQLHALNDRLLQHFIHKPDHRSRLIFDLDSTVVTVFGHQEETAVGYNPRYRGKRSYNPLLCMETNSTYFWDAELRAGNAELGMELPNCWILVSPMYHPMFARFDCERIPVLVSILYCRLWRRNPLITLWSPA